jgi:ligand-binding sensor domain-containing protein/signal transduction histidine kinase
MKLFKDTLKKSIICSLASIPRCFLVAAFLCTFSFSHSQEKTIRFQHFTIDEGLSQNSVTCILQDQKGFLWIGAQNGLNRYDGYEFTIYNWDQKDSTSISSNYISALHEDVDGFLWIGTGGGGLNRFDPKKGVVTRYKLDQNEEPSINENFITVLFEDIDGKLWVGTRGGLKRFDKQTGNFHSFKDERWKNTDLDNTYILSMAQDEDQTIWVGTLGSGLFKLESKTDEFRQLKHDPTNPNSLASDDVWSLLNDSHDELWIGMRGGGLARLNKQTNQLITYRNEVGNSSSLSHDYVYDIVEDDQNLWIGTLMGLNKFNRETGKFSRYHYQPDNPSGLNNNSILTILKDNWGDLWVGTMGGGVNRIGKDAEIFNLYQNQSSNPLSLSDNSIWTIHEARSGAIWIGTQNGGLNKFDTQKVTFDKSSFIAQTLKQKGENFIISIFEDSRGFTWVGTQGGGLYRFHPSKNEYKVFTNNPNDPKSISGNRVWKTLEASDSIIWFGADDGVNSYNPKTEEFIQPTEIDGDPGRVYSIVETKKKDIWIGNWGAEIRKLNKVTGKFETVIKGITNSHGISFNLILTIYEDKKQNLWFGADSGLLKYEIESDKLTIYSEVDGLPNNVVYGILEDELGFLWISTNKGISRFDSEKIIFKNFNKKDGLQGDEFNVGASLKDSNGNMYFGGTEGMTVFDPNKIVDDMDSPHVVLIDFLLFNESVKPGSDSKVLQSTLDYQSEIKLNHKQYVFAFEFAAINYQQSEKIKYAYMLEPFNNDWIYTDFSDRKAVFTNVPAGEYTFRVKAANADGYWNDESRNIRVTIYPPWWLTIWAKLSYGVLILSLVIGFYKWRTGQLKKQKKALEVKVDERTIELAKKNNELSVALDNLESTQQHLIRSEKMASLGILSSGVAHEINNPLNFIQGGVIGLENLLKKRNDTDIKELLPFINSIQEGVKRAASIVKSLTQFSQLGGSEYEQCDVHQVIDNCLQILQSNLKNKEGIERDYTDVPFSFYGNQAKLHQAILNVITNANQAIDHKGTIQIKTRIINGQIELTFSDSGQGIERENLKKVIDPFYTTKNPGEGTGLGLYITYNIINEFKGDIEIDSKPCRGAIVKIILPSTVKSQNAG